MVNIATLRGAAQASARSSSSVSFTTLQAGRAIAAIAVVFFHAHVFFLPERLHPGQSVSPVFDMGYSGVEFFFVLSGFIMFLVHRRDIGQRGAGLRFLVKRVLRILPFYWCVLLGLIALTLLGLGSARLDLARALHAAFLLPMADGSPLLIEPAWTLTHEFLFYGFFALILFLPRAGAAVFVAWQLATAALSVGGDAAYPLSTLFGTHNLLFPMGMLAAWAYPKFELRGARIAAILGVLGFLVVGLGDVFDVLSFSREARTVLFGAFAMLGVAGVARLESGGALGAGRAMVFLGDASYAIYLVHGLALALLTKVMLALGLGQVLPPALTLLILVVGAMATGVLAHLVVERPLLRWLRTRVMRPRRSGGLVPGE
ncbi:acyltransferase [Salipiger sp. H15]|uniref:Acyltransferase n=1 Tax=Alloyangia sp. H15 TaxID=3029062 RepID=A0AAU8AHH4_9RHOB